MAEQSNQPGIKDLYKVLSDIEQRHDTEVKRLQEECFKYEEKLEQKDLDIERAIGKQNMLKEELEASSTQVESLKDFEAKSSALEIVNKRLSETNRLLAIAMEEKKAREKTIKENAKQKLERTETQWKKVLQGKEVELKRIHENYRTEKRELLNTWTLYTERMQNDLNKKDDELKRMQSDLNKKDDELKRCSALTSTKLTTNNPEITDLSDINRPTKLAEQWSELYDNEYTELFEALRCEDEKKIPLLLKLLKRSFEICQEIREHGVGWLSYLSENNTMHNPFLKMEEGGYKEPPSDEEPVHDEELISASSKRDKNASNFIFNK